MSAEGLVARKERLTNKYIIKDNVGLCQAYYYKSNGEHLHAKTAHRQIRQLMADFDISEREASDQLKRIYRAYAYDVQVQED